MSSQSFEGLIFDDPKYKDFVQNMGKLIFASSSLE